MKKLLIISILIIGNCLLDACAPDETLGFKLDLTGVNHFSMETYSALNQGTNITANAYAIVVEGSSLQFTALTRPSSGGNLLADVSYSLLDPVINITITSNADMNPNYPAGSELKALFVPLEIASHCMGNPGASNDCVYEYLSYAYINSIEQAFNEEMAVGFVERSGENGGVRLFALSTTEAHYSSRHLFTVRFDFQSGQSVELMKEPITFL